jgi:hypothetical protein
MDRQQGHAGSLDMQAAWKFSMDIQAGPSTDMQHGNAGRASRRDMQHTPDMQEGLAAWMYRMGKQQGHAAWTYRMDSRDMQMDMRHRHAE